MSNGSFCDCCGCYIQPGKEQIFIGGGTYKEVCNRCYRQWYQRGKIQKMAKQGKKQVKNLPALLTERELINFLRIPEITRSKNHHNVIDQLKRFHGLPCLHISRQPLYLRDVILEWCREKIQKERR